jgi:deazaflavin-dependent oxidoreductase (nitroreductase family)
MSDWNTQVIDEFRANGGKLGGSMAGRPLLLLHHTGAKSGIERVSPLVYQRLDNGYGVFASKGGADENPAWLHNLNANPEASIEVGNEVVAVTARVASGEEHDRIWTRQVHDFSFFADYQEKTTRDVIPVVVLEPR